MGLRDKRGYAHYNQTKSKKTLTIDNFHEDIGACKFFTLIYLNEYCFDWDLKSRFKFKTADITKYSDLLNDLGIIEYRLYSELDHIRQDVIRETTPDFDKFYKRNDTTYIQTQYCKQNGKTLFNLIIQTHKENRGFFNFITRVGELQKAFKLKIKEILEIEKTQDVRLVKFTEGVIVEQLTHKTKQRNIALERVRQIESKNTENLMLKNISSTELATIDEEEELKTQLAVRKYEENKKLIEYAKTLNIESLARDDYKTSKVFSTDLRKSEESLKYDTSITGKSKTELKQELEEKSYNIYGKSTKELNSTLVSEILLVDDGLNKTDDEIFNDVFNSREVLDEIKMEHKTYEQKNQEYLDRCAARARK
jgi:hypothetical protein